MVSELMLRIPLFLIIEPIHWARCVCGCVTEREKYVSMAIG